MSSDTIKHLKMLHQWVFVRALEDFEERDGKLYYPRSNIVVPDTMKGSSHKGVIVRIGDNVEDKNLKEGDQILFKRRAGFKAINIEGEKILVMKPDQMLAICFGENATDVNPLKDNVFLEWEVSPEFYPGTTIRKPDAFRKLYFTGIVRAIGPDVSGIAVGDRVFFDQFGGVEKVEENGKRYCFLDKDSIYCSGVPVRQEVAA